MKRALFFVYGAGCHLLFLAVYAAMAGFVGNLVLPRTIDASGAGFSWSSLALDSGLLLLFAVPHSVMARPGFKRWWTRFVPQEIERSTYVLVASACMALALWLWQPFGPVIWSVQAPAGRTLLWSLFAAAWLMVPLVTFLIHHFDLFGSRQVWLALRGRKYSTLPFRTPGVYRVVRHPLYVGWLLAFWATPDMTAGHLLFAGILSAYILAAIPFEERDLVAVYGDHYRDYRKRVPALIPRLGRGHREPAATAVSAN